MAHLPLGKVTFQVAVRDRGVHRASSRRSQSHIKPRTFASCPPKHREWRIRHFKRGHSGRRRDMKALPHWRYRAQEGHRRTSSRCS